MLHNTLVRKPSARVQVSISEKESVIVVRKTFPFHLNLGFNAAEDTKMSIELLLQFQSFRPPTSCVNAMISKTQ